MVGFSRSVVGLEAPETMKSFFLHGEKDIILKLFPEFFTIIINNNEFDF